MMTRALGNHSRDTITPLWREVTKPVLGIFVQSWVVFKELYEGIDESFCSEGQ